MRNASDVLVYDSGRFPLWFRIPAVAFGLLCLWLATSIAAGGFFDISLGLDFKDAPGSPLLGSLACFAIAAVWIFVWFAQLRILFDPTQQDLIVRTRGYFRYHDRRVSVADCREIRLTQVHTGLAGRTWRIRAEFSNGRGEDVTEIRSGIERLAESLERATRLPVRRYECEE